METQNKMGTMPVGKLLLTMAAPMMVSMLVQALYNVVDSVFVSHYDVNALTAVSLAFAAQNLMIGIATGTAVGVNALLSKALGERDKDSVNRIAAHGVFLAVVGYLVIFLAALFFTDVYFQGMIGTAEVTDSFDPTAVMAYGGQYLRIVCMAGLPLYLEIMFERLMQSTGRTVYTMLTQGIGAVVNMILDPIFIFDWGLGLGVAGAAWATVIGQVVAAGLAIYLNHRKNSDVKLSFRRFRPNFHVVGRIYAIGVPSIVMVAVGSVMNYAVNIILAGINGIGTTVFGAYFKLQSFFFMPLFGMNNGLIPIVAYNYGAKSRRRMLQSVKWAAAVAVGIMVLGTAVMNLLPETLLRVFEKDQAAPVMLEAGIPALRIISLSFPVAAVCIVMGSVFQALGKGTLSLFVSVARQLVVLLPTVWLLSLVGDLTVVWWAWPIAEIASLLASVIGFTYLYRKVIRHVPFDSPKEEGV